MKVLALLVSLWLFWPLFAAGAEVIDECIIRDFQSNITVQTDGSLDIKEKLSVDCGELPDKHGIFRILPTRANNPSRHLPINLITITDTAGNSYKYETIHDRKNNTITWKIGDPGKTIQGLNEYNIHYLVKNAVTSASESEDQLYWNLNGNFWQLETDKFQAQITFPESVTSENSSTRILTGVFGANDKDQHTSIAWPQKNVLIVESTTPLEEYIGITAQVRFPKGIVTVYTPTFLEQYAKELQYLWLLLPISVFVVSYRIWKKHGKDPRLGRPKIAFYEPPLELRPLQLGLLETFGSLKHQYISATIVDLAVRGYLTIKEMPKKGLLGKADWELTKTAKSEKDLAHFEQKVLNGLFGGNTTTKLSDQVNKFYTHLENIRKDGYDSIVKLGLIDAAAPSYRWLFFGLAIAGVFVSTFLVGIFNFSTLLIFSLILSGIIFIIFGLLMSRRTPKGAEAFHELEGFKLYMRTAEKHRAEFYEKENMFEKILPYAIAFGLTHQWIKAMQKIYGEAYLSHYPAWYASTTHASFNPDSFTSNLNSLSSQIGSSLSSSPSSSSGGGGFSGGGGGGGGGGSW